MKQPPLRVAFVATRQRVLACATALACALLAGAAVAQADPPSSPPAATRPVPATPGNLTREEKRCNAGLRRVDRQKEKLAETKRVLDANGQAAASCADARACERVTHRSKTLATRERNEQRQLGRLEAEARSLCDAAAPAAKPR